MSTKQPVPAKNIVVYSTVWCPDCKRAKRFLGEQRVPYVNIDIEQGDEAMAFVEKINQGKRLHLDKTLRQGLAVGRNAMLESELEFEVAGGLL